MRRWEYDGVRESPSKVVYEDGSETQFGYDVEGNLTAVMDALGQRYQFRCAFDNLLEATDPLGRRCASTTMRKRSSPGWQIIRDATYDTEKRKGINLYRYLPSFLIITPLILIISIYNRI